MTLRRFLGTLRPHAVPLALAAGLLFGTAVAPALAVALLHRAVGQLAGGRAVPALAVGLIALASLHAGAVVLRTWLTKKVAWRLAADLREQVHAALLRSTPGGTLGDRLAHLGDEIDQVQYGVSALVTVLRNPLALLGLLVVTVALAPAATSFGLLAVLPVGIVAVVGGRSVRRWTRERRQARASWMALAAAQLGALETIQALGAEAAEAERFRSSTEADRAAHLRLDVGRTLPTLAAQAVAAGAIAMLLLLAPAAFGSRLQDAVAVIAAMALAQRPLTGLADVWTLLQRALAALERVDDFLAIAPRIAEPPSPAPLPDGPLLLEWDSASWGIDGRVIVDDVTVQAKPDQILALVGPTGAGKTSLLRLGWRATDPTSGAVRLGGVDLREVSSLERQAAIALVPQDLVLWGRTVRENLVMGLGPDAMGDAALQTALRRARADFVLRWPDGLDTVLEEGGRGLSGGEKQRLCLARAWVRNARVWLLDEPTSQVDPQTTEALGAALREARSGRTIVVVAHDPGLVAWADRVVRIAEGRRCSMSSER